MTKETKTSNPSSVRLSDEGKDLQTSLAEHLGISKSAVLELALRKLAKQEGISARKSEKK